MINLYGALPQITVAKVIGKQLSRSGTFIGAHYYEAQHAKSNADFVSKIEGATQECEETRYGLELLQGAGTVPAARLAPLHDEARQLVAILVTTARKAQESSPRL